MRNDTLNEVVSQIECNVNDACMYGDRSGYYSIYCQLKIYQNDGEIDFEVIRKGEDITESEIHNLIEDAILDKYGCTTLQLEHSCGSNGNCDYEGCWEPLLITNYRVEEIDGFVVIENNVRVD